MYSKESQLKHNKKKKVKKVSKNKPTAHEKKYLTWLQLQDVYCYACGKQDGIEWHHVKRSSTDKKDHTSLIPLCGNSCHRLGKYSAHGNTKWFRETFPMEEQRGIANKYYEEFLNT